MGENDDKERDKELESMFDEVSYNYVWATVGALALFWGVLIAFLVFRT